MSTEKVERIVKNLDAEILGVPAFTAAVGEYLALRFVAEPHGFLAVAINKFRGRLAFGGENMDVEYLVHGETICLLSEQGFPGEM